MTATRIKSRQEHNKKVGQFHYRIILILVPKQTSLPTGTLLPTFYSLLDFEDEENSELPTTSATTSTTTLQPNSPKETNAISNYFQMLSTASGNDDERPNTNKENPIYEPLSSDDEN